jgi:hypothetical protein
MPATHRLTRREFKHCAAIVAAAVPMLGYIDKYFGMTVPARSSWAGAVHTT